MCFWCEYSPVIICGSKYTPIGVEQQSFIPIFDSLQTNKHILYSSFISTRTIVATSLKQIEYEIICPKYHDYFVEHKEIKTKKCLFKYDNLQVVKYFCFKWHSFQISHLIKNKKDSIKFSKNISFLIYSKILDLGSLKFVGGLFFPISSPWGGGGA